ncbi:MAG: lysine-2,3-aminomutase-like protein [Beijerinckiaceae bacterium]|nr:lysine-2,3-aminomutase-like protein [Beijerinckiaceae bacterium]
MITQITEKPDRQNQRALPLHRPDMAAVTARYPVAITPAMAALIDCTDQHDPIARQFLPDIRELDIRPEESADPIGDHAHSPLKGVVHRYPDRVLLKLLHVCPVYCRFCFRREMVGPQGDGMLTAAEQQAALAYIAANSQVWEVILTGGDPLMLSARRMADIMSALADIPHVKIVRLHSRVPVVDPARVTQALVKALQASGKQVYVAIHANHPRELTVEARAACQRLIDGNVHLVSQSVLLKGVNDDTKTLADLMRAFVETGIKPYYLHHADLAPGTSHFRVEIAEGQALMRALRGRLSGVCQPTYVLDLPGGHGKVPIGPEHATQNADGSWTIVDYQGQSHAYRESISHAD